VRYLSTLLILSFLYSCRNVACTEPYLILKFKYDYSGYIVYKFERYEKGSGYTKLLFSEIDTARYGNNFPKNSQLDGSSDYNITILATGKEYKFSDISYSGKRKTSDGTIAEMSRSTDCTRNIHYKLNGIDYKVDGAIFSGTSSRRDIDVEITK
jgi:hypothetical protein